MQETNLSCGAGKLLLDLNRSGFKNLTGIGPYIKNDIVYNNGVRVFKKEISAMEGKYDVIMFNSSFEYMPVRKALRFLLAKKRLSL